MSIPSVTITRVAGTLSTTAPAPTKALVVGPSSAGTQNSKYTFGNLAAINNTIGYGPAATAAGLMLDAGGSVDVIVSAASIAAANGQFTSASIGGAVSVAGTPLDYYDGRGKITKSGGQTTGSFQYSLDGGQTYTPDLTIQGTYAIPNSGLTLTFNSGTFATGGTFSWTSFAPGMNATDLQTAVNAFTGSSTAPTLVLVANHTQSASLGAALATRADSLLTTLDNNELPTMFVVPAGGQDGDTATTIAAHSAVVASTGHVLAVAAERCRVQVPSTQPGYANPELPFAFTVASRMNSDLVSTNPARYASGPMTRCSSPTYDEFVNGQVYQDATIVAPRSFKGTPGVFTQQGVLKSQPGVGYPFIMWGRVILLTAIVARLALAQYLNAAVRVKTDGTGQIDPRDANRIEQQVNSALNTGIMQPINVEGFKGHASAVSFAVDRTNNILTSSTLQGTLTVVPLANVSSVAVNLGLGVSVTPAV